MKNQPASSALLVAGIVFLLSGCQTPNFYYASEMPSNLHARPQVNAHKLDLAPLATITGGGDEIVPGDVLEITLSTGFRLEDQVPFKAGVGEDGSISLHETTLNVGGLKPQAAEALIAQELINSGQFRNPRVTVTFLHQKMNKVRVLGGVKEPRLYELRPGASDVVSAIAVAGGLAENAGANVTVRNPPGVFSRPRTLGSPISPYATVESGDDAKPTTNPTMPREQKINLASAVSSGINTYNLEDGGVVMVEEQDLEQVQVRGLVKDANSYDYPIGKRLTMLGALSKAKDVSNIMADKVYVIRERNGQRYVIQCSIREAKKYAEEDVLLEPGDIVSVEQTPATVAWEAVQLIRFGISGSTLLF